MINNILNDYLPIDYRSWILGNDSRNSINLKRLNLLTAKEIEIFDKAKQFNDPRNDSGQAELVTYFSLKLIEYIKNPSINREVVIPSAILHDIGFYFDADGWEKLIASGKSTEGEVNRRPHQNRGLLLAGQILEKVGYSIEHFAEIADIIGDHDTRLLPATLNGKTMRDSDFLWCVTYPCMKSYFNDASIEEAFSKMEKTTFTKPSPFNLDPIPMAIGRIELVNTLVYKFKDACYSFLKSKGYDKELAKIINFYNSKR